MYIATKIAEAFVTTLTVDAIIFWGVVIIGAILGIVLDVYLLIQHKRRNYEPVPVGILILFGVGSVLVHIVIACVAIAIIHAVYR